MKKIRNIILLALTSLLLFSCNEEASEGLFQEAGLSIKKETHEIFGVVGKKQNGEYYVQTYDGIALYNVGERKFTSSFSLNGKKAKNTLYADDSSIVWVDDNGIYQNIATDTLSGKKFLNLYTEDGMNFSYVFGGENNFYVYSGSNIKNIALNDLKKIEITGKKIVSVTPCGKDLFFVVTNDKFYTYSYSQSSFEEKDGGIYRANDTVTFFTNGELRINGSETKKNIGDGSSAVLYSKNGTTYLITNNMSGNVYKVSGSSIEEVNIPGLQNIHVVLVDDVKSVGDEEVLSVITSSNGSKNINLKTKKIE